MATQKQASRKVTRKQATRKATRKHAPRKQAPRKQKAQVLESPVMSDTESEFTVSRPRPPSRRRRLSPYTSSRRREANAGHREFLDHVNELEQNGVINNDKAWTAKWFMQLVADKHHQDAGTGLITVKTVENQAQEAAIKERTKETYSVISAQLSTLPRELRDMIYIHLWDRDADIAMDEMFEIAAAEYLDEKDTPCPSLPIVHPAYVGPDMALEAIESYYTHARKRAPAFHAQGPYGIKYLLTTDPFKTGLNPTAFLRQMRISFHVDDLDRADEAKDQPWNSIADIDDAFAQLLTIPNKKGFRLTIELQQTRIRLFLWKQYLDKIAPLMDVFEREGAIVKVLWAYVSRKPLKKRVQRNIKSLVKNQPELWIKSMKTSLEREGSRVHKCDNEWVFEGGCGYKPDGHDYLESGSDSFWSEDEKEPEVPEDSHSDGTEDECPAYEYPVWGHWWQHS